MFTFLYGNATDGVYRATSALLRTLNIKGERAGPWTFSADLIAKSIDAGGSLAALSDRAVTLVASAETALYVDAWGGTIGTTAVATTAFSFELNIDTKRTLKHYLGSLTPGGFAHGSAWEATLSIVMEFNATSKAFVDAMLSGSTLFQRQVRLKATNGTNIFQLDFAGTQDGAPQIFDDEDGVSTVEIKLKALYNSTLGAWMKASVTNSVAALP
jgi:hypothetical protein